MAVTLKVRFVTHKDVVRNVIIISFQRELGKTNILNIAMPKMSIFSSFYQTSLYSFLALKLAPPPSKQTSLHLCHFFLKVNERDIHNLHRRIINCSSSHRQ